MKFYSGFSLVGEEYLLTEYIKRSDFTVCGFSYGAIKAFQKVQEDLKSGNRVDTLQLLSPAFFQSKAESFKKLQLRAYKKNRDAYMKQFVDACFSPYNKKIIQHKETHFKELEELLEYKWDIESLKELEKKGVKIEVYLGSQDVIVDADAAKEFFLEVATVTYIKNANHFLQIQ